MERISVESSNIESVGYDPDNAILQIAFLSGAVYEYFDVSEYIYDELMAADSKGKYANKNIYKHFNYQRIG
ncbi:KTSC domain-containing protein [Desulfopila inferna]|uniref:KTSC domain-containing protein n=1 Tax=Desulfopila inferna TaxID=468528 RepID=UPI0019662CFC|nr:KTSC domain-containing protein [Desulfopila inferna]MBM9604116.1 KTSC domain-containing protein [Desulfopila inferna]